MFMGFSQVQSLHHYPGKHCEIPTLKSTLSSLNPSYPHRRCRPWPEKWIGSVPDIVLCSVSTWADIRSTAIRSLFLIHLASARVLKARYWDYLSHPLSGPASGLEDSRIWGSGMSRCRDLCFSALCSLFLWLLHHGNIRIAQILSLFFSVMTQSSKGKERRDRVRDRNSEKGARDLNREERYRNRGEI